MAVLAMQKINLCVLKKDRKRLLEILQRRGVIELTNKNWEDNFFEKPDTAAAIAVLNRRIATSCQALAVLDIYVKEEKALFSSLSGRKETSVEFYDHFKTQREKMLQMAYRLTLLAKKIGEDKGKTPNVETQIEALVPWLDFDISLNFKGTKQTAAFIGTLPPQITAAELHAHFLQAEPGIEAVNVEFISTSKDQNCVFICCMRSEAERVEEILRMLEFARPIFQSSRPPAERKKVLEETLLELNQDIEKLEEEIKSYGDQRDILEFMIDYYTMRQEKYQVINQLMHSRHVFFLTGYIPTREAGALETKLNNEFDLVVEFEEPLATEDVPVMLSNNGFSSPTESVIESYSMPGKGEVDPTGVTSIFFYILFGLMLSDTAYGIVLSVGCAVLLLKFKNMETGIRKMFKLFFFCGLSTIFWGIVFGSYFGDVVTVVSERFFGTSINIPALWFNPLHEPMRMLVFCFLVGIIHIYTGLAVSFYQSVRFKKYKDALYDVVFWYALITSLILILLSNQMFVDILGIGFTLPPTVGNVSVYIAAIAAIGIIITGGRESRNPFKRFLKGLYSLYNVTGYLSDVLSYSRLLALGLATSVIAAVINQMAGMGGPNLGGVILFILVFFIGHTMNIGISGLGAYVHSNRLQFVEFFGKFYSGGGHKFEPFAVNSKYYKFKEEHINE